jgi:hypothetical protein
LGARAIQPADGFCRHYARSEWAGHQFGESVCQLREHFSDSVGRNRSGRTIRTTIDDNNLAIFNDQLAQLDRGLVLMRDTTDALHDWPLLRIEGGDVPEIERGNAIGTEFVRVRQRVAGAAVELVFWRTMPLALQELVVTGVQKQLTDSQARQQVQNQAATSERRAANERTFITARDSSAGIGYRAVLSNSVLPDGRQQMVLRLTDAPVLLAIRGYLTPAELAELSSRLVPLRND